LTPQFLDLFDYDRQNLPRFAAKVLIDYEGQLGRFDIYLDHESAVLPGRGRQ
jgi:hypothetical protein